MAERATIAVTLAKTDQEKVDRNFEELRKAFAQVCAVAGGKLTGDVELAVGNNAIKPPISKPRGRLTVYQSAAAQLYDGGLDSDGNWVINANAATTCRFLFF